MIDAAEQRITAAAILAGSLTLGAAAARRGRAAVLVRAIALLAAAYVPITIARPRRSCPSAADREGTEFPPGAAGTPRLTVSVVVAARDEARALPLLLADLAAQDHRQPDGTPGYEIVVIDDRSCDGTGDAARSVINRHGLAGSARVVRRASGAGGKAAALTTVPLETLYGDIVAIFDADARLAPDVLSRAVRCIADGTEALTARRRATTGTGQLGAPRWLARLQDDEQTIDGAMQAARWSMGGCTEFRGDGMFVRRDRLVAAGGWAPAAVAEDLELSTRLAARLGVRVAWARDVVVWEEAVPGGSLWPQRLRWAEGTVRRQLALTGALLRSDQLGPIAKIDYTVYGLQTVLAPMMLGLVVGSVRARSWRTAGLVGGAYVVSGLGLGVPALGLDLGDDGRPVPLIDRLWRSLAVIAFAVHWLVVLPVAWTRVALQSGPSTFAPTPHGGLAPPWRPPGVAGPAGL